MKGCDSLLAINNLQQGNLSREKKKNVPLQQLQHFSRDRIAIACRKSTPPSSTPPSTLANHLI